MFNGSNGLGEKIVEKFESLVGFILERIEWLVEDNGIDRENERREFIGVSMWGIFGSL